MGEAVDLLNEMKRKKMAVDVVHYTTLIHGYFQQGKLDDVEITFREMFRNGIKPDIVTYNVLAGGLSRKGRTRVDNVLKTMVTAGLEPSAVTHNVIIEGLCIGGYVEEAEAYFKALEDKSSSYSAMVNGFCEAKKPENAYEIFVEGRELVSRASCFKLLNNLCASDNAHQAFLLLERMVLLGLSPGISMYGLTVASFCRDGDVKKAREVLDLSVYLGLSPNIETYTLIIDGYCKRKCLREAKSLFCGMQKRGMNPDTICCTVLINMFCNECDLKSASHLFYEMVDGEVERDALTYSTLLKGYSRKGDTGCGVKAKLMSPLAVKAELN